MFIIIINLKHVYPNSQLDLFLPASVMADYDRHAGPRPYAEVPVRYVK